MSWQVLSRRRPRRRVRDALGAGRRQADDLMVTGRGLDPWGIVPAAAPRDGGRPRPAGRCAGRAQAYAALLDDAAFRSPLHWGAARRSAYDALGAAGRAPRPWHARLPREPRGAADGGRLLPGGQAGRRDLPRRARRGTRRRPGDGPLRAARPAHDGAHLVAGAQGLGAARCTRGSGTPTTTGPTSRSPGSRGATCPCSRRSHGRWPIRSTSRTSRRTSPDYRRKTSGRARDTLTDARPAWVVRDGLVRLGALAGRRPHLRPDVGARCSTAGRRDAALIRNRGRGRAQLVESRPSPMSLSRFESWVETQLTLSVSRRTPKPTRTTPATSSTAHSQWRARASAR